MGAFFHFLRILRKTGENFLVIYESGRLVNRSFLNIRFPRDKYFANWQMKQIEEEMLTCGIREKNDDNASESYQKGFVNGKKAIIHYEKS